MLLLLSLALVATPPNPELTKLGEGPIHFSCAAMQLFSKPNRALCEREVLVKRGPLLLCCDQFEGFADDKGVWQRFVCQGNVRAERYDERMWSNQATFLAEQGDLILTGKPKLLRGSQTLEGERIVLDTRRDQAFVERPRGVMEPATQAAPVVDPKAAERPLPKKCPIPSRP